MTPDKRKLASGAVGVPPDRFRDEILISSTVIFAEEAMTGTIQNCQFRRILVGYDGSEQSKRALEAGLALASASDSKVEVLSVVRPPEPSRESQPSALIDQARKRFEQALRRISEAAVCDGIEVSTDIAAGHPAEQILHRAEQISADLVIVGQRGASEFDGISMGSVSERVLACAHCPVLLTR